MAQRKAKQSRAQTLARRRRKDLRDAQRDNTQWPLETEGSSSGGFSDHEGALSHCPALSAALSKWSEERGRRAAHGGGVWVLCQYSPQL